MFLSLEYPRSDTVFCSTSYQVVVHSFDFFDTVIFIKKIDVVISSLH
jgi:hypothetical protein